MEQERAGSNFEGLLDLAMRVRKSPRGGAPELIRELESALFGLRGRTSVTSYQLEKVGNLLSFAKMWCKPGGGRNYDDVHLKACLMDAAEKVKIAFS